MKPKRYNKLDFELEEFRSLMEVPSSFEEGFNWFSLAGVLFIAVLMVPGAIYMNLLAGWYIGPAAQWVTVILFVEVARRAQRHLKNAEIFVLYFMAGAVMSTPFTGLLWNQFFVRSDAASAYGIAQEIPKWVAPSTDSISYAKRTFLHKDWIMPILLIIFGSFFSQLNSLVLGYGLFRITSDIEKLPFPMAPVGAQGVMALSEEREISDDFTKKKNNKWRVFIIGAVLGIFFGAIYLGLPVITGAIASTPIQIFPIPFKDLTQKTQSFLPAVATGISWDLGNLIWGMVLPFFAMLGSFVGLIATFIANPILYKYRILNSWLPGDDTVVTIFKNNVDFYFSFTLGISIAIALIGILKVTKIFTKQKIKTPNSINKKFLKERGDINSWIVILAYIFTTMAFIIVSGILIDWHKNVMIILFILGFIYTPFISYVTARLEGIAGQVVEIPMIREASLILSGYKGVAVWFIPIPIANYGQMTVFYRQCELTGTKFTSIWKANLVLFPIIVVSSILFASFIWSLAEVPSSVYPYAQKMWELEAANRCIMYTSTLGEYSIFEEAFKLEYLVYGTGFGLVLFLILSSVGLPVFFVYGVVRGLGQSWPHSVIPQMIGALLGKYYFQKKLGLKWRQYIPVVAAGFSCGTGLITMLTVGFVFLSKSIIKTPF
jgi:hypothetical protein